MNKRILLTSVFVLLLSLTMIPDTTYGQWGIGASYEIRQEEPKNGFGLRVERAILQKAPLIDLRLRAHYSFFRDDIDLSSGGTTVSGEFTNYDFGLAAIGGVSIGLIKPYVGLGLGSTTFDLEGQNLPNSGSESELFWNALIGAEVSPIPVLKPFVEYRFQGVDEPEFAPGSTGRVVFGVSLFF